MAHLSGGYQFGPEGSFLCNTEMIVHRLTDDGPVDAIGPPLTDKMFYPAHHSFFIDQDSQEDPSFERKARLADGLDGLNRCGQVPFCVTGPPAVDPISHQLSIIGSISPLRGVAFCHYVGMTFEHQAGTLFSPLKDGDHIRRAGLYFFYDDIKAHFFQKVGEEKSHLSFTLTRASHTRNPDEVLSQLG
jgi:hypothetical protein